MREELSILVCLSCTVYCVLLAILAEVLAFLAKLQLESSPHRPAAAHTN